MNIITIKESLQQEKTLLIPLYKGESFPQEICDQLEYDPTKELHLSYGKVNSFKTLGKLSPKRIVVVGLGQKEEITTTRLRHAIAKALNKGRHSMCIWLDTMILPDYSIEEIAKDVAYAVTYSRYTFTKINTTPKERQEYIYASHYDVEVSLNKGFIIGDSINHARDLANMPSNYMYPETLASKAIELAKTYQLDIEILSNPELEKLNAGAILGVNRGSAHPASLIIIKYHGGQDEPYSAIVGKGLTFDSGGYNLKSAQGMMNMKFDMCGGANTLGVIELIARLKLPVNVMAVIGATENKIGPDGYNAGDVLVSLSGKTIEITNTDAEGRLVLADALTYAQRLGASRIIDMATLTGACVTALGDRYTGAFTNCQEFLDDLKESSKQTGELLWQLPLDETHHEIIQESYVADMTNAQLGVGGGSSLAAAFLEEFIEEGTKWIHLDIAGTSDISKANDYAKAGATGVMIETIVNYFENYQG